MRRRWCQFSLRSFLLATSIFAVWLGSLAEKARRQQQAVALLEAWGARIDYRHQWQGPSKPRKKARPPGWSWLRKQRTKGPAAQKGSASGSVARCQPRAAGRRDGPGLTKPVWCMIGRRIVEPLQLGQLAAWIEHDVFAFA